MQGRSAACEALWADKAWGCKGWMARDAAAFWFTVDAFRLGSIGFRGSGFGRSAGRVCSSRQLYGDVGAGKQHSAGTKQAHAQQLLQGLRLTD